MTTVTGLQIALASRLPMRAHDSIMIEAGAGIVGDRYHGTRHRHVTLQSTGELAAAEEEHGRPIDPLLTRRNVTTDAESVPRKPGTRVRLGDVELEVVRDAAPCKLLEDTLGRDARLALHKRAGVILRALTSGTVRIGDPVRWDG